MKKLTLKQALAAYGATDITVNKGFNYRSGFFNKGDQLRYFLTNDIRGGKLVILDRSAKDRHDHQGGGNEYNFQYFCQNNNIKLSIPRVASDFNKG